MNLTNEEIRIKIAKSLGYKELLMDSGKPMNPQRWESPHDEFYYVAECLPNYPESLDACAEFEKTLTDEELRIYGYELGKQTGCMQWYDGYISAFGITVIVRATALQRCLAYLKTKELTQ